MYIKCTPSQNSTKYRADDLGGDLISEYFCWMLGDPNFFFFGRSLPFLILCITLKNKKKICTWEVIISHITIQIGSNWYMDTGVRDLEVAFFKANSTWINDICNKDLSNRPIIICCLNPLNPRAFCKERGFLDILVLSRLNLGQITCNPVKNALASQQLGFLATSITMCNVLSRACAEIKILR